MVPLSPMMVSQYQLQLPDKEVLRNNCRNWLIFRRLSRRSEMNDMEYDCGFTKDNISKRDILSIPNSVSRPHWLMER